MVNHQFNDGDEIHGYYGNVWTRENGRWWSSSRAWFLDDVDAEWFLDLAERVQSLPSTAPVSRKISKSKVETPEGFRLSYRLVTK